jgi:hypothetical protein
LQAPKVYFGGMVYEEVEKRGLDIVNDGGDGQFLLGGSVLEDFGHDEFPLKRRGRDLG